MDSQVSVTPAWWLLAAAGIASIVFGLIALFWPGITLIVLIWLYGIYALVYGIVQIVGMFRASSQGAAWWTHLLIGLLSLAAGAYVLAYPGTSAVILLFVFAFWAIAIGIVEVVTSLTQAQFLYLVTGIISILAGLILLSNPVAGALALIWVIGVFSIVKGIVLLVGAFRTSGGATGSM